MSDAAYFTEMEAKIPTGKVRTRFDRVDQLCRDKGNQGFDDCFTGDKDQRENRRFLIFPHTFCKCLEHILPFCRNRLYYIL